MAPKKKQEKMSLGNFLSDQSLGTWADEMEDMPMPSSDRGPRPTFGGGRDFSAYSRADPSDRGPREQLPLPTRPPYTAHLGNLSFDVTNGDIEDFFAGCEITNVRIVEDKIERKPKGFGYVEFASLDGLKKALDLSESNFQGRRLRVTVAEPPRDREPTRELNDWTRKGPLPDLGPRRPSGRGFEAAGSDAGSDRGGFGMERGGSRRGQGAFEGDGKIRDFGNWERKGPLSPVPGAAGPDPARIRRNDRSFDRRASPSWGEGTGRGMSGPSSDGGSRPPRRDISERAPPQPREPSAADMDTQWRARMQPDKPAPSPSATATPDISTPSSPVATHAAPASRPKLNLAKRTVSNAPPAESGSTTAGSDSKASPFGAAKPIDTSKRDQEIEERRQAAKKQREEQEAQAKAEREKQAAEKAARGEVAGSASKAATEGGATGAVAETGSRKQMVNGRTVSVSNNDKSPKENGSFQPKPDFKILQRMEAENGGNGDLDIENEDDMRLENANGAIVDSDDKDVKPQTIIRDPSNPDPDTTADTQEQEGWAVVGNDKKKSKPRGGGSQRGRALAS